MLQINRETVKTRHDWVGKAIHWELCKKSKFDHANKWYMHNPNSIVEDGTYKILWDFNIKTDHLISARRPDLIIIGKKISCKIADSLVPAENKVKLKENKKKDEYFDFEKNCGTRK